MYRHPAIKAIAAGLSSGLVLATASAADLGPGPAPVGTATAETPALSGAFAFACVSLGRSIGCPLLECPFVRDARTERGAARFWHEGHSARFWRN
jgi:hypothetical protein